MDGSVAIVGYMGSGKTTLGRYLARALSLEFVDLDRAIVKSAGKRIPEIFASTARDISGIWSTRRLVQALDGETPSVVACGGGAVVRPDNRGSCGSDDGLSAGRYRTFSTGGLVVRAAPCGRRAGRSSSCATRNASLSTGRSRTSRSRSMDARRKRWRRRYWRACRDGRGPRRPSVPRLHRRRSRPRGDRLRRSNPASARSSPTPRSGRCTRRGCRTP